MLDKIFLNHGAVNGTGAPMTLGVSGNNTVAPLPTQSFMGLIEMFNNILCTILGNCIPTWSQQKIELIKIWWGIEYELHDLFYRR